MRLDRRQKVALGAGTAGFVAVAGTVAWLVSRNTRGHLICPSAPVVAAGDLAAGDFVALQLGERRGGFAESTWGRVVRRTIFGNVKVELVGPIDERLEAQPLNSDKHGYELGDTFSVDASCVWDAYRPPSGEAKLVCGAGLSLVPEGLGVPRQPDKRAEGLRAGDDAAVVVASGGAPVEMLWLRVVSVSPGNQVLTGEVTFDPISTDLHGLERGDQIQFVRDCVVEARLTGGF